MPAFFFDSSTLGKCYISEAGELMASQKVLLLTVGGAFADSIWRDVCRWSDARATTPDDEWSSDDWPAKIKDEIDTFVEKMKKWGYTPPVLYRSEYVDCWSMGDMFETALVKGHLDFTRRLYTSRYEVIATWVRFSERIIPDDGSPSETTWLYNRVNEAIAAWSEFAENRLVVLVRSALGGLWTDEEVTAALGVIPSWWAKTEGSPSPESSRTDRSQSGPPASTDD